MENATFKVGQATNKGIVKSITTLYGEFAYSLVDKSGKKVWNGDFSLFLESELKPA